MSEPIVINDCVLYGDCFHFVYDVDLQGKLGIERYSDGMSWDCVDPTLCQKVPRGIATKGEAILKNIKAELEAFVDERLKTMDVVSDMQTPDSKFVVQYVREQIDTLGIGVQGTCDVD